MTDTTDLDLSVLAKAAPPERDERPKSAGTATPGKPVGEPTEPDTAAQRDSTGKPRRRPNRMRQPATESAPTSTEEPKRSRGRTFVRDDEILLPDYNPGMFVKPITEAYLTIAAVVMPFSAPIAQSIMQNAEPCAKAWDNAAKADKKIRAYLLKAMSAGVLLPLLIAHLPIMTVVGVVLFPGKPRPEVQLPEQSDDVINPMSNGMRRPK